MTVRDGYKIDAIAPDVSRFDGLIADEQYDAATAFFRERLDRPTLYGLEASLIRSKLLKKIVVDKLTDDESKCFVLYSLALSLNLTGGYPNRSIPLYERHDLIAERIGDKESLSQSLGHHAKALRQVGRFRESEMVARRGLAVIRERGDHLREAVNLYWLGMGLAHRGEAELSEVAFLRSLRIFRARFAVQSEGVVHAFSAQSALWSHEWSAALEFAEKAIKISRALIDNPEHADHHGAVKIYSAACRMKGEALVSLNSIDEGELALEEALSVARSIEFVEEILPALRALALKALKTGDLGAARNFLDQSWELAERGEFRLYDADSYNILALIEKTEGRRSKAIAAAEKAFSLSVCDGVPFAYRRGLDDAKATLSELGSSVPEIPICREPQLSAINEVEINPDDDFYR